MKPNPTAQSSQPEPSLFERFSNSLFSDAVVVVAGGALPWIVSFFSPSVASICEKHPINATALSAVATYALFLVYYIFSGTSSEESDEKPDTKPNSVTSSISDSFDTAMEAAILKQSSQKLESAFNEYVTKLEGPGINPIEDIFHKYPKLHISEEVNQARMTYRTAVSATKAHKQRNISLLAPTANPTVSSNHTEESLTTKRGQYLDALLTSLNK